MGQNNYTECLWQCSAQIQKIGTCVLSMQLASLTPLCSELANTSPVSRRSFCVCDTSWWWHSVSFLPLFGIPLLDWEYTQLERWAIYRLSLSFYLVGFFWVEIQEIFFFLSISCSASGSRDSRLLQAPV